MPKHMTATEARKNFFKVIETAEHPGMPVTITHDGHPKVIVMSAEEFEGWQDTLEIMADPTLLQAIKAGMRERETVPLEALLTSGHAPSRGVRRRPQGKRGKAGRKAT